MEAQVVVDSEGPSPCKMARKQHLEAVQCEGGSSTEPEIDSEYSVLKRNFSLYSALNSVNIFENQFLIEFVTTL